MRLTDYYKRGFVRAVMNDIPQEDYVAKIQKLVQEDAAKSLPLTVLAVLNDPLENNQWLQRRYLAINTNPVGGHCVVNMVYKNGYKPSTSIEEEVRGLWKKHLNQIASKQSIERKLYAEIQPCTTLNAAKLKFPKFLKYLPEEKLVKSVTPNLPATTGLIDDLRELGWPKQ